MLDWLIGIVAEESGVPRKGLAETTWKRPTLARGIESDQCYYFLPEKIAQYARARNPPSTDIADCPDPDLAVEVDISRPETDRAGIYAAPPRHRGLALRERSDDHRTAHAGRHL